MPSCQLGLVLYCRLTQWYDVAQYSILHHVPSALQGWRWTSYWSLELTETLVTIPWLLEQLQGTASVLVRLLWEHNSLSPASLCVSKLTIIGSNNDLSPGQCQAIIWTNAGILLIRTLGTNSSEILSEIHTFSCKKMHLKIASVKWRQFCLSLNASSNHDDIPQVYLLTLTNQIIII